MVYCERCTRKSKHANSSNESPTRPCSRALYGCARLSVPLKGRACPRLGDAAARWPAPPFITRPVELKK
eukprot:4960171-Pleurochrysis_carterae.AAC.1